MQNDRILDMLVSTKILDLICNELEDCEDKDEFAYLIETRDALQRKIKAIPEEKHPEVISLLEAMTDTEGFKLRLRALVEPILVTAESTVEEFVDEYTKV